MTKKKNADGTEVTEENEQTENQQESTETTEENDNSSENESTDKVDNEEDKDLGFPKDTPVIEMEIEEQRNYWKHNSRKHEKAKKELADARDAVAEELKTVKGKLEALEANSTTEQTDVAEAVAAAKLEGAKEERAKYAPKFLDLEIKALLGDRYDGDRLKTILAVTNTSAFFNESGEVNSDSVKSYFELLFPAPVVEKQSTQTRESHGGHKTSKDGQSRGEAGRTLYQQMRGKK